ncbi:hypothetical protein RGU39_23010 [Bacillus wiedmannii]|uniref:hypothetical protein n=1 Tax=Bacillus wiedmannii TaxID=1890302 RepID=UPI002852FC25|nr:hypothetical protein [Bacillus wiedmannii]MDR4943386.1 hypothetical protein [Bacillus wiedmannii]
MKNSTHEESFHNSTDNSKENPPTRLNCGTMSMHEKLLKESEEYRKEREKIEKTTEEFIKNKK